MTELHLDDDVLTDLALAQVGPTTRDQLTAHLGRCESCRTRYAAVADAVEHVLLAAPRVEPPAGFSQRVLATSRRPTPRVGAARRHRPRARRTALLVAAALVVGIGVGAVGSAQVLRDSSTRVTVGAPLRTSDGTTVGAVQQSQADGRRVLVISVAGGPAGVRYACWLVLADGSRQPAGAWALDGSGNGSWVVTWPEAGRVTTVEMVSDSGTRWAAAPV